MYENIYIKRKDLLDFDCLTESRLDNIGIKKDLISLEELLGIMEDLYYEKERLQEELDHEIQDKQDNYKPLSPYELYGVSERDFY